MVGMGFVHNWSGLMAARWFLGLTEAGLFPGINYYLSCWYKRSEFGVRAVSIHSPSLPIPPPFRLTFPTGYLLLGRRDFRVFWRSPSCCH